MSGDGSGLHRRETGGGRTRRRLRVEGSLRSTYMELVKVDSEPSDCFGVEELPTRIL